MENLETELSAEKLVLEIKKRGLEVPAVALLETFKPLGYLLMHLLLFFSPFLAAFIGTGRLEQLTELLRRPEEIEKLILQLEK